MNKIEKCKYLLGRVQESRQAIEDSIVITEDFVHWIDRLDWHKRLEERIERKIEEIEYDQSQNVEWRELRLCCLDCCVSEWVCDLKNGERVQVNDAKKMRRFRTDHKNHDLFLQVHKG